VSQNSREETLTKTIIQLIREKKPRNVKQLVDLAKEKTSIPEKEIIKHVLRLQSQGKITFKELATRPPQKLGTYLKTKEAYWYWATLILIFATTVIVFTIPEEAYPLVYIRYVLGAIFVLWLPGYSFIRALFPAQNQSGKSAKPLDPIERIALSLGMSLALAPIVGLILNYTPWGIRLTPIVLSLLSLTTIFATAAIIREHQNKTKPTTHSKHT
jgi:predicted Zn-ribbon and HTH transcriptional regulator